MSHCHHLWYPALLCFESLLIQAPLSLSIDILLNLPAMQLQKCSANSPSTNTIVIARIHKHAISAGHQYAGITKQLISTLVMMVLMPLVAMNTIEIC